MNLVFSFLSAIYLFFSCSYFSVGKKCYATIINIAEDTVTRCLQRSTEIRSGAAFIVRMTKKKNQN